MAAVRRTRAPAFLFLLGTLGLVLAALQSCLTTFTGGMMSHTSRAGSVLQLEAAKKPAAKKPAAKKPAAKKAVKKKATATKASAAKKPVKEAVKKVVKNPVKRVSIIATGPRARMSVWRGTKTKTVGGLTKESLIKNKKGAIVSKKASTARQKTYATSKLKVWCEAVKKARKELKITGFQAIGGKTAQGKQLYEKAKALYKA
mmetsp:Transcript_37487/g.72122  ORF Transcript_37487/g.72122 Transcript_37487/m.72122 type:complete len:202 (-) Transcript_37487:232-837(-)